MDRGNKRRREDAEPVMYLHPHLEKGRREANCEVIVDLNSILCQEADLPLLNEDGSPFSMTTSSSDGASGASSKTPKDSGRPRKQIVSAQDRHQMEAYPFHLASGLKVYEKFLPNNSIVCGIECVGCRSKFRRLPRKTREVENAIASYERHLEYCRELPRDLRKYLHWMHVHNFDKDGRNRWIRPLAERIYARMDQIERDGNETLKKAEAREKKKKRRQKQKKSHSVLERVGLVESRSAWL